MDADVFENGLNSKKPFRNIEIPIEIPKELLENILLIPAEKAPCPFAPIIKIGRELSSEQVKEMMAHEEEKHTATFKLIGTDANQFEIPTLKENLIRKDLYLLSEIVATGYYSKIRKQNPDWENLYQIVEIDWSLSDFYPGDQAIHYEVFTKREILIRTESDKR